MTELQPLLKLIDLSKHFGGLVAVKRLSLEVYPGEVVGLGQEEKQEVSRKTKQNCF